MINFSNVSVMGFLVKPLKKISETKMVGTIAINDKRKDGTKTVVFLRFKCKANDFVKTLEKGDLVFIQGFFEQSKWIENDVEVPIPVIVANSVILISRKEKE